MRRTSLLAVALLVPLGSACAQPVPTNATAPAPANAAAPAPVVAVVTVATPPGVGRERIIAGFQQAAPSYARAPGLVRKDFTIGEGTYGGVYLWSSRAAAEAFYSPAWRETARARGGEPQIVLFDAPVHIEGTNPVLAAR